MDSPGRSTSGRDDPKGGNCLGERAEGKPFAARLYPLSVCRRSHRYLARHLPEKRRNPQRQFRWILEKRPHVVCGGGEVHLNSVSNPGASASDLGCFSKLHPAIPMWEKLACPPVMRMLRIPHRMQISSWKNPMPMEPPLWTPTGSWISPSRMRRRRKSCWARPFYVFQVSRSPALLTNFFEKSASACAKERDYECHDLGRHPRGPQPAGPAV